LRRKVTSVSPNSSLQPLCRVDPVARVLHTSDWQVGMKADFLPDPEVRGRYKEERLEAAQRALEHARNAGCEAVVVAGDMFDQENPAREWAAKCLHAIAQAGLPVVVLPGNHDFYDVGTIYDRLVSGAMERPENLTVITDERTPIRITDDLEIVGVPWTSKHPARLDVLLLLEDLGPPPPGVIRILVLHGQLEAYGDKPSFLYLDPEELAQCLDRGLAHYVALGDHHSRATYLGGRAAHCGTIEPTSHDERDPGWALMVDIPSPIDKPRLESVRVGRWRFLKWEREVNSEEDLSRVAQEIRDLEEPRRTWLKLKLMGTLRLEALNSLGEPSSPFGSASDLLAYLEVDDSELVADTSGEASGRELGMTGATAMAFDRLSEMAREGDATARTALRLMYRYWATGSRAGSEQG
jgi:DNA repair exonuclease SbcCD nuclease subunit